MTLDDLNSQAFSGTASNLVKLLKAFGHNKEAVDYIQKGVSGQYYHYTFRTPEDTERELLLFTYKGKVVEKAAKDDIMADFYAKQGVFDPKARKPASLEELNDKFNAQAKQIEELKKTVAEQQKTIDALRKSPPENPSIH